IHRRVPRRDVLLVAEEEAMPHQAELLCTLLERIAVGPVADEQQPGVDAALADQGEGLEEIERLLDAGHPSQPADHEPLRRDTEAAADLLARLVAADTLLQLDPEPHDDELLRRGD